MRRTELSRPTVSGMTALGKMTASRTGNMGNSSGIVWIFCWISSSCSKSRFMAQSCKRKCVPLDGLNAACGQTPAQARQGAACNRQMATGRPAPPPACYYPRVSAEKHFQWTVALILFGVLFLGVSDTQLVAPLLPLIASDLAVTPGHAGIIVTTYSLAAAAFALFVGPVSDRVGRKK